MDPTPADLAPRRVAEAVAAAETAMEALDRVRRGVAGGSAANTHGGDPGLHRNRSTVVRHAVTHLVGARAAAAVEVAGPVVDVGAGTAAFSGLLSEHLGRELHVVDVDARHTALAAAAFPGARVHTDLAQAPAGAVVTAFEVVEHLPPAEQVAFAASLVAKVLPGGALVLSTPDESGYPGGWSGYAPHVGPVDADRLAAVVAEATGGWPVRVLRVDGPTFGLTRAGALVQRGANQAWNLASRAVGGLDGAAVAAVHRLTRGRPPAAVPPEGSWTVTDAADGDWRRGTGMVAVARRPA